MIILRLLKMSSLFCIFFTISCTEKDFDPENAQSSFVAAKEPYDDENYDIALNKLGEFNSRFPYSQYATEAELLIAHSHFNLSHYAEATASYSQFIKLHPRHPQIAFAQFRIGESYWADAPEEIDREQDLTEKAVEEWELLIKEYPSSEHVAKAKELIKKGRRRMSEAQEFIASFYCKQELWHSCAYRYISLAENSNIEFKDLIKISLNKAAYAFEKLANQKTEDNNDENLYYRKMTKEDLKEQARLMKEKAKLL